MANKPEKTPAKRQEIVKAEPAHALSPFEEMDRMFDAFLRRGWTRPWRMEWPGLAEIELRMPKVDVIERDTEIVVKAEVPGIDKNDIDVQVTESAVTIKGSSSLNFHAALLS